jgi:beta-glucosidase-like glycosyl hydrolase
VPSVAPARRAAVLLTSALLLPACSADGVRDPGSGTAAPTTSSSSSRTSSPSGTASPTGTPPSTPEDRAEQVLAGLDRRERVVQLFVVGVPLDRLGAGDDLARGGIGGLFLAGRSSRPGEELRQATDRWTASAPGPLPWIAVDQEGGAVQALSGPGFDRLPAAVEQGALPPDDLAALADGMAAALADAGITLDLAPVADVVPAGTAQANPPIGVFGRQYGSTPDEVGPAVEAVVEGLAEHGVTATLKHFPGLGRVTANTDTTAGVTDPETAAGDPQVELFGELAGSAAHPFVMTSSATYPRIDPSAPAVWSEPVTTGLLREDLGFDGVVISDDLGNAAAVAATPPGERAVRFLEAGGTLVLTVSGSVYPEMRDAVLGRDREDPRFRRVVDDAVRTALVAKARAGLLPDD